MTNAIKSNPEKKRLWLYDVLLLGVLLVGAYFRFSGIDWGALQYQHPDELFLTSVTYNIQPVHSLAEYFNTATSTLNPNNAGAGFFVYGTLPVFLVRGLADLTNQLGNLQLLGRQMSALIDLATVALLYFVAKRLYGPRVGILASMFSALAVMQIQQSHFYTTDNFATFFMLLGAYFAVEIMVCETRAEQAVAEGAPLKKSSFFACLGAYFSRFFADRLFWFSAAFGLALGMAVASKLNAFPLAILLPGALAVRYFGGRDEAHTSYASSSTAAHRSFEGFLSKMFVFMVVGALFSFLAFRVFQPYAFSGLGLNPRWLSNIREQQADASPNAGLLWNLQWARRTHLYSFANLTVWGLGLPLGILAWAGFLWMGWRILKGEWRKHILLWSWTALYFGWQSLQYNPNMRYQLPIYPLLAMMAAWAVYEWAGRPLAGLRRLNWRAILAGTAGCIVLVLTFAWAYAFSRIYLRPETRVAASEWIYQNVPGPINLQIQTPAGIVHRQLLPFQAGVAVQTSVPYQTAFTAQADGVLNQILLPHVTNHMLRVTFLQNPSAPQPVASGYMLVTPTSGGAVDPASQRLIFDQLPTLSSQQNYLIEVEVLDPAFQLDLCGPLQLSVAATLITSPVSQSIAPSPQCIASANKPYQAQFTPQADGPLTQMTFSRVVDLNPSGQQTLHLLVSSGQDFTPDQVLATASVTADFVPKTADPRGSPVSLVLNHPAALKHGVTYYLRFDTTGMALAFIGSAISNETDIDWNLPFRLDGYDGFNGIYRGDLNLQVYWSDDANKLSRYERYLNQTDYIFIPTAHQYMQTTRLPERYPLTTAYYRQLLGCPVDKDIIWCYRVAEPGMFKGNLGFDLVTTFEDYPAMGPLVINDQNSEESFTFYDHPKVLIFQKDPNYNPAHVQAVLGAVDLSNVVPLTPGQADHYKSLMLSAVKVAEQEAAGTWSDLFNRLAIFNSYPALGAVLWYLVIFILGLLTYPLVRAALPGLADHGYPLARVVGLLLWAWLAWMAGSVGLSYSRLTIAVSLGLILLLGLWQAWRQRAELKLELKERWKYYLMVEAVFLSFFLLDLLIRLGNSDLWHPSKGGERPMDFAYLNAILKSTSFPPYDPWFAGGYINYYYYGYVIVGTPVKLLGIVPSIAYNFILPTLFACVAAAAFSVGWNLLHGIREKQVEKREKSGSSETRPAPHPSLFDSRFIAGISASSAMVLLGNLGVVRMLYQGFQQVGAPGGMTDNSNLFQRIFWAIEGFLMVFIAKVHLPYGYGDWYWNSSRVLPASSGSPITEFPLFTFIYSDLHAHLIALMITIVAIAWALSVLLARARWKNHLDTAAGLLLGGLIIGALKPTNTWDFYTYLILGAVVLAYAVWRYAEISHFSITSSDWVKRLLLTGAALAVLIGASLLFYQPFTHWFLLDSTYTKVSLWTGGRSDITSYLTHWGVFLFFIVSWMVWETRQWLAATPVSSLRKLRPYRELILAGLMVFFVVLVAQQIWVMSSSQNVPWYGVTILWLALPLAAWAAVLLCRPGLPDAKRLVLFMVGTGLLLTTVVEIIVLGGDIGRMNTVFKLYYQAWVLLGLSAAAGFGFLLNEFRKWTHSWRSAWQTAAVALTAGAALFLLMGGMGKVQDRMAPSAPRTLDSMTYMNYATYNERDTDLDLSADYRAILWMQDNVKGSPVIAEAPSAGIQYEWLNRFSIYTGLPDVVGWEWHQEQQRLMFTNTVRARGVEEDAFYVTTDLQAALNFLHKYNVRYIIVGQLERAKYMPGGFSALVPAGGVDGLAKFETYNGKCWHSVYRDGSTVIYEVNP
jgi:YYY domain-containing protein